MLVGSTSVLGYHATKRMRPAGARSLTEALRGFFEWIGTFALFFSANLALGFLIISLIRGFTPRFVAFYALQNLLLLVLTAAQAFVFQQWWQCD